MPFKAARRANIAPFYAMEVMRAANAYAAAGGDVLHLEVGEPGLGAPAAVIAAAHAALDGASLGYTEALGLPELRERIAEFYDLRYGVTVDAKQVVVTFGASGAFLLSFLAAFDPGDRVALAEPCYPAYRNILAAVGIEVVPLAAGPAERFQPTVALLEEAGPLDGVVVASPANPTGSMMDDAELEALVHWCDNKGVRLVADEIYHGITYERAAPTVAGLSKTSIVVNSFSKYFAMTGWRLGWAIIPEDLAEPVDRLAQSLFVAPPTLPQRAALVALECTEILDGYVRGYARNRRILLEQLPAAGITDLAPADGAFYIYANVSAVTNDAQDFCARMLKETGVATTPGIDFDPRRGHQFIRISFAGAETDIAQAMERLRKWLPGS